MNIKRFNGNDFPGDKWVRDILSRVNEIVDYLKRKIFLSQLADEVIEAIEAEVELDDLADEVTNVLAPLTSVGADGQVLTSDGTTAGWESLPTATATTKGIVKGGEVPSQVSGSNIVGFIGEVVTTSLVSGTNNDTSATIWTNTLTLGPGIWHIIYFDASYRSGNPSSGQNSSARARIWNITDSAEVVESSWYHYISNVTNDYERTYVAQFYISTVVNISATKQYRGEGLLSVAQGSVINRAAGKFYAIRVG